MNVSDILTQARETSESSQAMTFLGDSDLMKYLNNVYHDLENEIINEVDEDFFSAVFITDLVANQKSYQIRTASSTQQ
jgi:hypothetical protein